MKVSHLGLNPEQYYDDEEEDEEEGEEKNPEIQSRFTKLIEVDRI